MRTFKGFNSSHGAVCPICMTGDDKEIVLIPVSGTESGNNMEAIQVHTECLQRELMFYPQGRGLTQPIIAAGCDPEFKYKQDETVQEEDPT